MNARAPRHVRLHNDEPALLDALGFTELVERVGEAVAYCHPPQVFGVHGDWGSGKTSFLHQLHWHLTGECPQQGVAEEPSSRLAVGKHRDRVTVVWFEAWRYQHEKAPVVALLQEIRTQLPLRAKALQEARKLGEVAIRGALLSLEDLTRRIGFQAGKVQAAGEEWEERNLATRLPSHLIREHLENALKELLGRKGGKKRSDREHRLVVLVDDLDRCEPETAYQLLEGIKIYLNLPSCVFVLGMNQRILEGAVARHLALAVDYGGDGGPEAQEQAARRYLGAKAREYMEKICRDVWHLPLVHRPHEMLHGLLADYPDEHRQRLLDVVEWYRCLPPIPRKIKGYANLLLRFQGDVRRIREALPPEPHGPATDRYPERWAGLVVVSTYLYHFRHPLYRLLWSEKQQFLRELQRWCRGEEAGRIERHVQGLSLRRTSPAVPDDRASTPQDQELLLAFHDPAEEIFHVQDLLVDLGAVTEDEVDLCLLR